MSNKFKSELLWAAAKSNGGAIEIRKEDAELARTNKPFVSLEMSETHIKVTAIDEDNIIIWPENEQRIDIIGQNGNNGEHYNDEQA